MQRHAGVFTSAACLQLPRSERVHCRDAESAGRLLHCEYPKERVKRFQPWRSIQCATLHAVQKVLGVSTQTFASNLKLRIQVSLPGLPFPQGESQEGSFSFAFFQSAKSHGLFLSEAATPRSPSPSSTLPRRRETEELFAKRFVLQLRPRYRSMPHLCESATEPGSIRPYWWWFLTLNAVVSK